MSAVHSEGGPGRPMPEAAPRSAWTGRGTGRPLLHGLTGVVDQHGHGVLHGELGLGTFEAHLAAATRSSVPAGGTLFDTRVGLALRRWCPPLLGLEPFCSPVRYLARRRELGAYAAGRALLRGSGIEGFVVAAPEAPPPAAVALPHGLTSAGELRAAADRAVRACVPLGALAAQVADASGSVRAFVRNTAEALHATAGEAAAFSCPAVFREARPPEAGEVQRAADRWLTARAERRCAGQAYGAADGPAGARDALTREPALVRHLLWSALVTRRPVQLRCEDPARLDGFLRATRGLGSELVLLSDPPHHASAARLAAGHPHVYADAGTSPALTLAEAPFGKLLFTTHATALPELYVLRARAFVQALEKVLTGWTEEGSCTPAEALRVARRVTGGNARRLYGFDAAGAG